MNESDFEKLLTALDREHVEFVILGGLAAALHGSAYVTADMDICYSRKRENLENLARALESFHPSMRAITDQVPFRLDRAALRSGMNFTLTTDAGDIDILGEVTGMGSYEQVATQAEEIEIFSGPQTYRRTVSNPKLFDEFVPSRPHGRAKLTL